MSKIKPMNKISYLDFFPYNQFRMEQEDIIKKIEKASKQRNNILLSAPNGTGKTIIALSALLPVALEKDLKIIYMCRTHAQNTRIIKELNKVSKIIAANNLNLKINGLSIRGRNEMCLNKTLLSLKLNPKESMSVCSDLRKNRNCSYFINLLKQKDKYEKPINIAPEIFDKPVDAEDLINFCNEKNLCPYFLSKYLLESMRLIICNYQWIFNPFIRENFLMFIGKELQDCIIVIDECHNAIDVATDVNSERLTPYLLRLCLRDLEMYRSPTLMQGFIKILLNHLTKKKNVMRSQEKSINPELFLYQVCKKLGFLDLRQFKNFITELQDFGSSIHEERISKGEISRDYLGSLAEFWLKWINTYNLDSYFFSYNINENKGKKTISMEIIALDPREITVPILKSCYTSIHLSGTVNPYVYNNLIGLNESGKKYTGIISKSPFDKENIKAVITEGVDTRRENRTNEMFKKMVSKIEEVISCTPANVAIFCASYKILKSLLSNNIELIIQKNHKKLFIEESGLSASENAMLIENYKYTSKSDGAVLLGVCGGRNSEGEDYPGDFMNSVIIAGFPYHLPTPRVDAKIIYYDKVFNNQGWNFAYLYPAIQRANQASGRPIRKIKDKGAIIFMDSRFKQKFKWISDWIREEIEIVPDKKGALTQYLYPFWH
ncbi:MAG: helicase C-terminal domain-containing protein [Promethearchaeota archaeon]